MSPVHQHDPSSEKNGRSVYYQANTNHPLFPELRSMVNKVMGLDQVMDSIITRLGDLEQAYLIDDYSEGKDTGIIDLVLVGNIDQYHLSRKSESYIKRTIRTLVLSSEEFAEFEPSLKCRSDRTFWSGNRKMLKIGGLPIKGPSASLRVMKF